MSHAEDDTSSAATMSNSPESQINDPVFDKFSEDSGDHFSWDTNITPNSEISPPNSPRRKNAILSPAGDKRAKARSLAASLSLEEQVRHCRWGRISLDHRADEVKISLLVAGDFWRSKAIPSKGISAFKTSDGPNGARGAMFKAGTKVRHLATSNVSDIES